MKHKKYVHLGIETLCLLIILTGLVQVKHEQNISQAKFDSFTMDPDTLLQKTKVQKLSGSVDDLDNVINDQMDAMLGRFAEETMSNMSSSDKAQSAIENGLSMFTPDQVDLSGIGKIADMNNVQSDMSQYMFMASAASQAALNAKFRSDDTKEKTDAMKSLNDTVKKKNEEFKDRLGILDKMNSKLNLKPPK